VIPYFTISLTLWYINSVSSFVYVLSISLRSERTSSEKLYYGGTTSD
jgi:hypothetical protein